VRTAAAVPSADTSGSLAFAQLALQAGQERERLHRGHEVHLQALDLPGNDLFGEEQLRLRR
jgi:hypothetical protein